MQASILADDYGPKVKEEFVLKLSRDATKEAKESAQVLHFGSDWSFEELLQALDELNPKEHPNVFVIVIESQSFDIFERIEASLAKFGAERPLIIQLTSTTENLSKFYYKAKSSAQFLDINPQDENNQELKVFWSFLSSQNEAVEYLTTAWMDIIKFPNFIKFLKLFENLFFKLILKVTKNGTKADLLKVLEAPTENEGRVLSFEAQYYLSETFVEKSGNNSRDKSEDVAEDQKSSSVLLTAIEHEKTEIIDYLITYCTHLIQQLPIVHQLQISTAAFKSNQLDVLCDLIDIADFPFPKDFDPDEDEEHVRLNKLINERNNFERAIKKENFEKINKFIDSHSSLKYVYSIDNYPALSQAIEFKKFGVFYYLKSLGFEGEDCQEILEDLSKEEKQIATQQAVNQRKANVKLGLVDVHKSVMLLATRSLIHNRKISKEKEAEYRQKITNWLKDIHKVAPEMLDVAASCEYLKIIFDFESETVENASLAGPYSLGSTYPVSKWIFIGAKLTDKPYNKPREQQIKGVLAHELCHYVMCLVYNNKFLPYFEDAENVKNKLEDIVKAINKWYTNGPNVPDDECNGNISTVFTCYDPKQFHLELIVRPVQNQVEFDDNPDKIKLLEEKYKNLIDFWRDHVLPDLQKFCEGNQKIIKLNKVLELLPKILKREIKLKRSNITETLTQNKVSVVTTNVPTLLFIDIVKNQKEACGNLMDSENFFTEPQRLCNEELFNDFKETCKCIEKLNIFVDCTKEVPAYLNKIFVNKQLNYIFIVSSENQYEELMNVIDKKRKKNVQKMEVNYDWKDLTEESQNKLLEIKKINFQNNTKMSMKKLLKVKMEPESDEEYQNFLSDASELIDDVLLNQLMDDKEISINSTNNLNMNGKNFNFLNIKRDFLKKTIQNKEKNTNNSTDKEVKEVKTQHWWGNLFGSKSNHEKKEMEKKESETKIVSTRISQDDLLNEVKNNKFVLISDMAGNGKSWAMKNFAKILSKQNPTSWVTYVDLKQFIKELKEQAAQQVMPEFSTFMAEKILKQEQKFEAKIFKKLYKDGKVFIFLDGFDEIAPDCAEFVSNLAQSFEQNGGNQLWIATRDYFEVDLRKKLGVDFAYGLDEMYDRDGIEMIAKSWILSDLGEKIKSMTLQEFNDYVKDSSDYKKYKEKAEKIVAKVKTNKRSSVGMPQMYKMIADGFKNEQNLENLKRSKIYEKYIKSLYKKCTQEKGEIREEASIEAQQQQFNFWRFHRFHAIASKFPKLAEILFPGYDGKDLRAEDVVGCGIVSIKDGKIYFNHETLREYFIVEALVKALQNEEINEKVLEVLVDVLTLRDYKVIRMFLNDIIEPTNLVKSLQKMKKFVKKFTKFEILQAYFEENLENFVDVFFLILKDVEYEKIKKNLEESSSKIAYDAGTSEIFLKFQDFLFEFLNSEDLKNLIKSQEIVQEIFENKNLGFDVFTDFVLKIENKIGFDFVQKELKRAISFAWINNVEPEFNFIFNVKDQNALKFRKFMKMLQKFLSSEEILKFLKKTDNWEENILFKCVERGEKEFLEILWTEIENYFASQNKSQEFKELVMQQDKLQQNILHKVAECENLEIHEVLWKILLNKFENREELKDFVLQKNGLGNSFIHCLVSNNKNPEIIKWNLKNLKKNFNNSQFQEILQSRGNENRNLLYSTALGGHKIEVFKLLWQEFCSSFKSDQEFLKASKEINDFGKNILKYAARKSPVEIFNFLIEEFDKKCSKEETKKMLSNSDNSNQSLLHHAALNESTDVFKAVWKKFQKYLTKEEILEIAKQVSNYEENFLFCVNSSETFEFAIEELEKIATKDEIKIMLNIINIRKQNFLQNAAERPQKSLNFHESLWKIVKKYFEKSEILNLIKNVDKDGNNVLHIAVFCNPIEVVEFTWNEIKSFLSHEQQIEYLKMKGKKGKNLIELCQKDENKYWMKNLFDEYKIEF